MFGIFIVPLEPNTGNLSNVYIRYTLENRKRTTRSQNYLLN